MFLSSKMRALLILLLFFGTSISTKATLVSERFYLQEKNFFQDDSTDFLKKAFKRGHSKNEIIRIQKGERPKPSNYLKWRYRHRHQRNFRRGASFLIPKNNFELYKAKLGYNDGLFVMSKKEMDDLLNRANGKISFIKTELGIPENSWNNTDLVRVDVKRPKKLNLRIPSGNETGANEKWLPGGKLPKGYLESVIDPVAEGRYTAIIIILNKSN